MKVVILCGGKGTRLREETEFRPKPLVEVGGVPLLVHIMKHYSAYGHKEFILCLGYKGDAIKDYFLEFDSKEDIEVNLKEKIVRRLSNTELPDWKVICANTGLNSATGSRIKQIQKYIGNEDFMVTYGDGVSNLDINDLIKFHNAHGKIGTVTTVPPRTRFGRLTVGDNHKVSSYEKKTTVHDGWIDGGFFVFKNKIFDHLEEREDCELEGHGIKRLAEQGELLAYKHTGFWHCVDTIRDHELLNAMWDNENKRWKI